MAYIQQLGLSFHLIMKTLVKRGNGPHYTEIASALGVYPDDGKSSLKDVINTISHCNNGQKIGLLHEVAYSSSRVKSM